MGRIQQALSCALIIVALFTLDTKALSRVDPRGYRPANTSHTYTQQQQKWQAPQHQQLLPANFATQRSTMQAPQWNNGVAAAGGGGGGNYNQWSTYNQSIGGLNNNKNQWNQYNQTATTNPWQRYNTTYGGGGNWNVQPQNRPYSNESHLYPTLPGQVINGGHRPFQPVPTVNPNFNNQWNQSLMQPPYGVPSTNNRSTNWWPSQNKTNNWGYVAPTTPQPYYRPPNSNNNGGSGSGQTNWWNHTKTNNNNAIGWGGSNPNAAGYPGQSGQASGQQQPNWPNWGRQANQTQPNSNNWRDANTATGLQQPSDNTNSGWGSTNNWQAGGGTIGAQNPYNSNSNSNNPNAYGQNIGGGSSGTQLAPLGGDSGVQQPSNGGIPLAPIGGGNNAPAANSPFGWNGAGVKNPNSWNHGGNGGSQLAPLAPLSYGGGSGGNANNNINNGGSNPYANMFNK